MTLLSDELAAYETYASLHIPIPCKAKSSGFLPTVLPLMVERH